MVMVQIPTQSLTLEAFLQFPETKPASEYVNGKVVPKPMPQGQHSLLQLELAFFLTTCFRRDRRARVFPELHCTCDVLPR